MYNLFRLLSRFALIAVYVKLLMIAEPVFSQMPSSIFFVIIPLIISAMIFPAILVAKWF